MTSNPNLFFFYYLFLFSLIQNLYICKHKEFSQLLLTRTDDDVMRMIITFLAAILFCPFSSFLVLTISASLPQPLLCINRSILIFLRKTLNTVIEVNIHDLFICDDTSHLGIKCPASKPLFQKDAVLYLRSTSKCLHRKSSNGKRPLKTKSSVD